ncbi:AAA family ATPase [Micromonospora profundi]|uniref:AAA family ATPase n=1 Tax=Micromonospora profundi TaxID=1420889 RepID=UPI0033A2AEEB
MGGGEHGILADRVDLAGRDGFVGRHAQRHEFHRALGGAADTPRIFLVHGMAGIGKSALLRQFADDARGSGRNVIEVDGRDVGGSVSAFARRVTPVRQGGPVLLMVDGFEHCRGLETWLREAYLPGLPGDALVVLSGRHRPQPRWTVDPGWLGLVRRVPLGPLRPVESAALLAGRGVPAGRTAAVLGFAAGHPLALALAAESAREDAPADGDWVPGPYAVRSLLDDLLGRPASPAHEYGLRVCGLVRHVTVDLLRAGLDAATATVVFDWLGALTGVTPALAGLLLPAVLRHALRADGWWRDPDAYQHLRSQLWSRLLDRAGTAPGEIVPELLQLIRAVEPLEEEPMLVERPYTADRRAAVLRLARAELVPHQATFALLTT